MPSTLRDRLQRIQGLKQGMGNMPPPAAKAAAAQAAPAALPGWESAGYMTLRRDIGSGEIALPAAMPERAGFLMPGIARETEYADLLFFDLETTGLSGGAGTMAFLGAFGRLALKEPGPIASLYELRITQYLLLDYPGEGDFIAALLGEFQSGATIVSYNGKSFDSQILKTRCLMNAVMPPECRHADLLHPARRLWKRVLADCSQGTVEAAVLGLDREGDTPGAMAPEIWFSFLKNGEAGPLEGICEHNRKDIAGLAAIFSAMAAIARDPLGAHEKINFDFESFALRYGSLLRREGSCEAGREWLLKAAGRPAALRALAIDSERRLKDAAEALSFAEQGMALLPEGSSLRKDFERRLRRLRKRQKLV